jgi:sarcosine oxidase
MGACTARELAERGHDVTLFEQFKVNHTHGSSHGRSRIIRKAYPDAFYTAIMDEAYGLWHELQSLAREQIVFETGLLYFGNFESQSLRDVHQGLQQLSVPHELLDHEQVKRVFPRLVMKPGEIGIFTPEAGWVNAERAVTTCVDRFTVLGGILVEDHSANLDIVERDFDRYVVCPGAWISKFVEVPVKVTVQSFGYVDCPDLADMTGPVWIEDSPDLFYGFPSEPASNSFKIGVHKPGPKVIASGSPIKPTPADMQAVRRQAAQRFKVDRPEVAFHTCLYTSTVDEDFLLGRHGDNGFFISACSGHGFKFGPWMGKRLADFVEEKDAPENHPRFCWPKPRLEA